MFTDLTDDELFHDITLKRAEGRDFKRELGALVLRWRGAAAVVIRRVQGAFMKGAPDEVDEIFQESVAKLVSKGLDQFRGVSDRQPGKSAGPKTFFLRIVKHCAIDRYRKQRDELDPGPRGDEEEAEISRPEAQRSMAQAQAVAERREASEEYWAAFGRLQAEHPNEAAAWDLYHHQDVDDHVEVARLLGISVVNSYKRVSRAQAWLKLYVIEARQAEE